MLNRRSRKSVIAVSLLLFVAFAAGCSKSPQKDAATVRAENKAKKELVTYQQLVAADNVELAVSVGRDLVKRFPDSPIASEVNKTLPGLEAKAKALENGKRAAGAWKYTTTDEGDVMQHIASLYTQKPPAAPQRVALTLRRHAELGQQVFLDGEKDGFECSAPCTLSVWFDNGQREAWTGELPPGAGPKLFVKDDANFVQKLDAANLVTMSVRRKNQGLQTLVFDVSGFNPKRWPKLGID